MVNAQHDITAANSEALSAVRWSSWILVAAVVLSLVSSILIVWRYVGRNVIARLRALSDRMLTLAQGDLKSDLPSGGTDEMAPFRHSHPAFARGSPGANV